MKDLQVEEIFDKKLHKLEVRINKLEDIMIDALRSNNIFAMDPELKEIWDNEEDDLWDNL
ncbi:MAG TPA: hypothetical protein PLP47_05920 [Methanofastidiosum sp.]|nr:hypothetical protein [Methanofastidiosum sp.]HOG74441.1 hypothetical protein [Methanofastidiosum sp.]